MFLLLLLLLLPWNSACVGSAGAGLLSALLPKNACFGGFFVKGCAAVAAGFRFPNVGALGAWACACAGCVNVGTAAAVAVLRRVVLPVSENELCELKSD